MASIRWDYEAMAAKGFLTTFKSSLNVYLSAGLLRITPSISRLVAHLPKLKGCDFSSVI